LAAAVMLEALKALRGPSVMPKKPSELAEVRRDRVQARRFFYSCLRDEPAPCNLNYCCEVLGLERAAVLEGLRKRQAALFAAMGRV